MSVAFFLSACATSSDGRPGTEPTAAGDAPIADAAARTGSIAAETISRQVEPLAFSGRGVTMESAVQRALSWHPSIDEAVGRYRQQGEAVAEARSGYLPTVSWGVDSAYDSERSSRYSPVLNLNGSQMLYDFGAVDARVEIATAGVAGGRSQVLLAMDDLARETAQAVVEIQRNQSLAKIARDQIDDTSAILDLVRSRTDRGASTRSDQLQAEARVQAAESTLLEIEGQLQRWRGVLTALVGAGVQGVSDVLPAQLAGACLVAEPYWSRVPAVMQAEAEGEAAAAQVDLTRAEGLPTLSLDGRVGSDIIEFGSSEPEYRLGLNVSGSIFNGGETAARRNAAAYALAASGAASERARVDVLRNLAEAAGQVSSMQRLTQSLEMRQAMMRETRDLYRAQYVELGTRTLLDLLNADQELHAARFDGVNVEHDVRRLRLDCAYFSGGSERVFAFRADRV
ncbi:TolC family outer membrane protein [Aureimonas mangrovi]|uniref:TolC family outer membrane protein n=1 Tax=Aureimonas mangrovi TaxID=2758041 RepID=UPI001FE8A1DA|nr:TolC family outer membrane protein [Aureimonas mangrovi]